MNSLIASRLRNVTKNSYQAGKNRVSLLHRFFIIDKRILLWIVTILILFSSTLNIAAEPDPGREYRIKAAFLYNFAKFVEWPDQAWRDDENIFFICIVGENIFGTAIHSIEGKTVNNRSVKIIQVLNSDKNNVCHIVFVSPRVNEALKKVLEPYQGQSVLTIGETTDFLTKGGIISLLEQNNKIRFSINQQAANENGLRISSQLLQLADQVVQTQ